MRSFINDILSTYLYLNRFRSLFIFVIISLSLMPVFLLKNKNAKENDIKYPIEVVESIDKDTKTNNKYEVTIKRIEMVETEYVLHTDSTYHLNDTIHPVW